MAEKKYINYQEVEIIKSVLDELRRRKEAKLVVEADKEYLQIYSIDKPPIAICQQTRSRLTGFGAKAWDEYYIIGREEDINEFDRMLQESPLAQDLVNQTVQRAKEDWNLSEQEDYFP